MIKRPIFSPRINIGPTGPAAGVQGPVSSTDSNFAMFSGSTGLALKDNGLSLSTSTTLTENSDTKVPSQKAVKTYVDTVSVVLPVKASGAEINTGTDDAKFVTPKAIKDSYIFSIMSTLNPIGTIREFNVSTNPNTLLGFGTWAAFGTGRVTVAIDVGQTEFDTLAETGGAKTHTLISAEMPVHTHIQDSHAHTRAGSSSGGSGGIRYDATTGTTITVDSTTATNQNTGGGGAHNNLQPYIVVYRWCRTA